MLLALFALVLVALGFVGGYGYGFGVRSSAVPMPVAPNATPQPTGPPAPTVKGLRAAPNDKFVAFTGVYDGSRLAARIILNLQTGETREEQTPPGWQDYITQWSHDGRALLFERERIPRPVADTTAGLYSEPIGQDGAHGEPKLLTDAVNVPDEKITAGFWTPDGKLAVKTRREPKSLYVVEANGEPRLLDKAGVNFQQHRAVREKGRTVFYTVRDVPNDGGTAALFRVENGQAKRLSEDLPDAVWVFLEENARHMVVCRKNANGTDWDWTLYAVSSAGARKLQTALVPGDVITVYWSPDGRHILGAGGQNLWIVDIPTLQSRQISNRTDWNADDACWLWKQKAVVVAAQGVLSRVDIATGETRELWRFPSAYWR
jgi:dipeptidyl aminopeptidase/acylaminoacyl peptidase